MDTNNAGLSHVAQTTHHTQRGTAVVALNMIPRMLAVVQGTLQAMMSTLHKHRDAQAQRSHIIRTYRHSDITTPTTTTLTNKNIDDDTTTHDSLAKPDKLQHRARAPSQTSSSAQTPTTGLNLNSTQYSKEAHCTNMQSHFANTRAPEHAYLSLVGLSDPFKSINSTAQHSTPLPYQERTAPGAAHELRSYSLVHTNYRAQQSQHIYT